MKITSFNANGIRAAARKGFFDWFASQDLDVLCVQETKAREEQLGDDVFKPEGYHRFFHDAACRKGYSGVAIYCKKAPDEVRTSLDWHDFDHEGRYIEARFGQLSVVSFYLPSGTSGEIRQDYKERVLAWLTPQWNEWLSSGRDYVLCGDFNVVRSEQDIKNWKSNQKNSGCLPHERAWLNGLIADEYGDGSAQPDHGWHDAFREANQDEVAYTWWSQRGAARANNVGWRIDYQLVTPNLAKRVESAIITSEPKFSDHAPFTVTYRD